jgi:hypothetical protein
MPGINEHSLTNPQLIIQPNPAKENIFLTAKNLSGKKAEIKITDMLGQIFYQCPLTPKGGMIDHEVRLCELGAGIYFVSITTEKEKRVERFVKE